MINWKKVAKSLFKGRKNVLALQSWADNPELELKVDQQGMLARLGARSTGLLAEAYWQFMHSLGGVTADTNYVELELEAPSGRRGHNVLVTIRKCDRPSPHNLRQVAEARVLELEQQVKQLQSRPITDSELADELIRRINELMQGPPNVRDDIASLFDCEVDASLATYQHPTLQVTAEGNLRLLGFLNGVVGTLKSGPRKGWGHIIGHFTTDGNMLERLEKTDVQGS